jgi:hypothetical protein
MGELAMKFQTLKKWLLICGVGCVLPLNASTSIEGNVSYFRPSKDTLRSIYGSAWIDYQVKIHQGLFPKSCRWKHLGIFATVDFLEKHGHSGPSHASTKISMVPIALGLQWTQPIVDHLDIYFALAPKYYFLSVHDHNPGVVQHIDKNGCGAVGTVGFLITPCRHFFFDLFTSYSYKQFGRPDTPALVQGQKLQVSGLNVGGGIGYEF